jgi:hypothetical protein
MFKRFFGSLTIALSCALLLIGCGGGAETNSSNTTTTNKTTTTTTTTPATTTTTSTPASTSTPAATTASGDKIGVPECDDYLTKYEACVSGKVPAAAREQYNSALEQTRKSWRQLADNPQTRSTLAQACKMANDQAKQSLKAYGCDF